MKYECVTNGFKIRCCKADGSDEQEVQVFNGDVLETEGDYIVKDGFILCYKDSILGRYHFRRIED